MKQIKLTKKIARKVLEVVDAGLVKGLGTAEPGKMCVEAAVCFALGLPHGDDPRCVGKAVKSFKIRLNDARWPSDKDRTNGMRKLAIAQLGSDEIDQRKFAKIVALETIRQVIPLTMRYYVGKTQMTDTKKERVEVLAKSCEGAPTLKEGREFCLELKTIMYAYAAAAAYAADDAAAAAYAAAAYADAAAYAYAAYAAYADDADFRLQVLTLSANIALAALITLKSPGVKWLDLCD